MTPDNYAHHDALQNVCARCRVHTRVNYAWEDGGKLYATIVSALADPRALSPRFEKIGYDVVQITHLGGDTFHFEMVIRGIA